MGLTQRNNHIAIKTSLKLGDALITMREEFISRPNYNTELQLYVPTFTETWDYSETRVRSGEVLREKRRVYFQVYYNDQHATDDRNRFNHLLDRYEDELAQGRRHPDHESAYQKYFEIRKTPVRGLQISCRQDAIDQAEKDYGYFALLSNGIKDPVEALRIYRLKDLLEKRFGNLKERLNMRRISVASEENSEGMLFVQFVALILQSYLKKQMDG